MSKYEMLVRVLDGMRQEASGTQLQNRYLPNETDIELVAQARSRAYVHLYLKVMFGITDFAGREKYITDGGHDGGIDGYFIDRDDLTIYILQSKFRANETNFENKAIEAEEILVMDINRILGGEERDEAGNEYNGKIKGMVREISNIPDIGRYSYRVVIIANVKHLTPEKLKRLVDGYPVEVFNFERCYSELLYPVLAGTYFKAHGLTIQIDLSNKSAGSKIGYSVTTEHFECDITVVFAPTAEIARIMSRYRNSLLEFNPRSYLEFEGEKVNSAIRDTIVSRQSNEFALLNNGITIISDETNINEKFGKKNKAQLHLVNPQIINGGQTAYTLSRIFDDAAPEDLEKLFEGKEVLVKVITVINSDSNQQHSDLRKLLIERISTATNSQTTVTAADRASNEPVHLKLQTALFDRYGLLYERKRGEFNDGVRSNYVGSKSIVDRNILFRVYVAVQGRLNDAAKRRIFVREKLPDNVDVDYPVLDRFAAGYFAFKFFQGRRETISTRRFRDVLGKVHCANLLYEPVPLGDIEATASKKAAFVDAQWNNFLSFAAERNIHLTRTIIDTAKNIQRKELRQDDWLLTAEFRKDATEFFDKHAQRQRAGAE